MAQRSSSYRLTYRGGIHPKPGVYGIWSPDRQSIYIGASKNVEKRFEEHRTSLEKRRHTCQALQDLYNLHHDKDFIFEVLVYAPYEEIGEQENLHITRLQESGVEVLNLAVGGVGLRGVKLPMIDQLGNYMTIELASKLLGIGSSSVRGLITDGTLRGVRIGGTILVDQDDVHARAELYPPGTNHRGAYHQLRREGKM